MNCTKCGNLMKPDMKFCAKCGTPAAPQKPAQPQNNVQPKPPVANQQPVQNQPQKPADAQPMKKAKKDKKGGKNIALKIIAIILVIAVLASGGLLLADNIMYKNEIKADEYITDFPVLKQKTELMVYDADKFPSTNYKVKVERLLNKGILKSDAFRKTETVLEDISSNLSYKFDFEKDGDYIIRIIDITPSVRTQPVTTTKPTTTTTTTTTTTATSTTTTITSTESTTETTASTTESTTSVTTESTTATTGTTTTTPTSESSKSENNEDKDVIVIIIIVEVDDDNPEAVDKVTLNSKKGDEPIVSFNAVKATSPGNSKIIEATDKDFEELETMIYSTSFADFDYKTTSSQEVVSDRIFNIIDGVGGYIGGYNYFYDDYSSYGDGYDNDEDPLKKFNSTCDGYYKVPKEKVKRICENIYNVSFNEKYSSDWCYIYGDYFYCGYIAVGDAVWSEYKVTKSTVVDNKYEIVMEDYLCHDDYSELASTKKIIAEIKIIDGERYWSIYKIEEYDPNTEQSAPQTDSKNDTTIPQNVKVGDYITFGKYEQDNNTSNGNEDIEWLVLEVKAGKVLVVSKYGLDAMQYNSSRAEVTWENCTLRGWLNNNFYNATFSDNEKANIPTVTVLADSNSEECANPGNPTQDKIFLLSVDEVNRYFTSDSTRQCKPTDYAVANGVSTSDIYLNGSGDGNCRWWICSGSIFHGSLASNVRLDGYVDVDGESVGNDAIAVRPAMWITLK